MRKLLFLALLLCSCNLFSMNEDTVRVTKPDTTVIYIHQDEVFTLNQAKMAYKVPVDILENVKKSLVDLIVIVEKNMPTHWRDPEAKGKVDEAKKQIKLLEDNFYV